MRLLGGVRIVLLAVVSAIAFNACVAAPAPARPALRVLTGGAGLGPTPSPTMSARPEPPIGVIMSGRVVIACDMGTRCTYFARLVPLRTEAPDPTLPPDAARSAGAVTLAGVDLAHRGFGPTARIGRPADQEPRESTLLMPGLWHIDAWTTSFGVQPDALGRATRMSCGLDFELRPGQALSLNLALGSGGCAIRLGGALTP